MNITDLTPIDECLWYDESDATFYFTKQLYGNEVDRDKYKIVGPFDSFLEAKEERDRLIKLEELPDIEGVPV